MLGHAKLETTQIYTRLAAVDPKKHHKEHHPRRVIDLAYSCGLRRCELHSLDISDICSEDGTIRVRKRGKERVVPVGPATLADLQHYIYPLLGRLAKFQCGMMGTASQDAHYKVHEIPCTPLKT